ncbi:MAG TPA: hypothetical protein PLA94_33290 [Myxococcota bacterium]|nr:hypothetical protein [Myxococcota bacterium]
MKLPDATCLHCGRPMETGRLPIKCDECGTWLWVATDGERIYLPKYVPVAHAQAVSEQIAQLGVSVGMDAWLEEAAKSCKCCVQCWEVPCGGCAQGAGCDNHPCSCDEDPGDDPTEEDLEDPWEMT